MAKRLSQAKASTASTKKTPAVQNPFQVKLQGLLKQKKYRQALEEIKQAKRRDAAIEFTPSEAEILSMWGQQEFEKGDFKQAEATFRQALDLGLAGVAHYWIARTLLAQKRLDAALTFIQSAFEQDTLPKEYAICYLKLLLLKGDTATVEELITKQSKRFLAAQLHWTKGVLALKANQPEAALPAFAKVKRPLTPGDVPQAWIVHTQQVMENWDAAAKLLGVGFTQMSPFLFSQPAYTRQPILQRLALVQHVHTGLPPLTPYDMRQSDQALQEAVMVMGILQLLDREDYHNAAHVLLNEAKRRFAHIPELASIRSPLFTLAGQQALRDGEPQCTEAFWEPLLAEKFDPQLAVNLLEALELNESDQERQRLLTRLLKWVEQDAKQHPDQWQGDRLKLTQANLHCRLADVWMALGRFRAGLGAVQQAERIYPNSPEVIGRKGLIAASEENYEEAVQLLTQALEQGCQSEEVYGTLLSSLDELENPQAKLEARRRFGKPFGDLNPEAEVTFAPWLEALYTQSYPFFSRLVQAKEKPDSPLRACQIFVEAAQGTPTSSGRVSLNQEQAKKQWDALLKPLSPEQQIPVLQAIVFSTQLFAKREKGIAAVINQYLLRLANLGDESPQAREAHLVALAVKENNAKKMEVPLRFYLETVPQPGNALAQLQLQARKFGWIRSFVPFLEDALKREPQNPLLLLARATVYAFSMPEYEELKQRGFEIARRIQDARALQAFREEQAFVNLREAQAVLPDPDRFDQFDEDDVMDLMEAMIRRMFGGKIPKAELDRMMPELKQQMLNDMPMFMDGEDDDDFDDDDDVIFTKRKRRKSFRDL